MGAWLRMGTQANPFQRRSDHSRTSNPNRIPKYRGGPKGASEGTRSAVEANPPEGLQSARIGLFHPVGQAVTCSSHALHHRRSGLKIRQFRIDVFGHQQLTIYPQGLAGSLRHGTDHEGAGLLQSDGAT